MPRRRDCTWPRSAAASPPARTPSSCSTAPFDGAGRHQQGGRLVVPDNLTPLPLPPYAPELNSMENVWEYLRSNWLSHKVWNTYDAILDACCDAWNTLTRTPERLTSITSRSWATAVIE
jgi:hypothetical protein